MIKKSYRLKYLVRNIEEYPGFFMPLYEYKGKIYKSLINAHHNITDFVKLKSQLSLFKVILPILDKTVLKEINQQALYAYVISDKDFICGEHHIVKKYIEKKSLLKPVIETEKEIFQLKELYYFTDSIKEWRDVLDKIDHQKFRAYGRWIRYERQNIFEMLHKDICWHKNGNDPCETADKLKVFGGNPLVGEVEVSGANEAALAILAASVISTEAVVLTNVPHTKDVSDFLKIINSIGGQAFFSGKNIVSIDCKNLICDELKFITVKNKTVRRYFFSALYARFHDEKYIDGRLNPEIRHVLTHAINCTKNHTQIQKFFLNEPSLTLTMQLLIVNASKPVQIEIFDAAKDPCVVALAHFLNAVGISVKGAGTDKIVMYGGQNFSPVVFDNIPDYFEAGIFICAAIITKGYVKIKNIIPRHLNPLIHKCVEIGAEIDVQDEAIIIKMDTPPKPAKVVFGSYPQLSSDYFPIFLVILGLAQGRSIAINNGNRDYHTVLRGLEYMNAAVSHSTGGDNNTIAIKGVNKYTSNSILYAEGAVSCIALLLAALSIDDVTFLHHCKELDTVLNGMIRKLNSIGAIIANDEMQPGTTGRIRMPNETATGRNRQTSP